MTKTGTLFFVFFTSLLSVTGCGETPVAPDTGGADDAGAPGDAGRDAGSLERDAGIVEEDAGGETRTVPMFVAVGMMGRSTISCDDGRSWVADRAFDTEGDALVCGIDEPLRCDEGSCRYLRDGECRIQDPCDCGHHTGFGKGVAFGNGWFVATWGWGSSGSVRRSRDGVVWEQTLSEADGAWVSFGGLAYGNGRFVLASRHPWHSPDGAGWVEAPEADFRSLTGEIVHSVRNFDFIDAAPGRFIASASPPEDVLLSDDGETFRRPASRPAPCAQNMGSAGGGIAHGNGVTVAVGADGRLCTSTDAGDHWTEHAGGIGAESITSGSVIFTGEELFAWGKEADRNTYLYRSDDGVSWTATVTDPPSILVGPVARSPETGTFVTTGRIWNGYERQQFYRSEDGLHWEALPEGAFVRSHGIFHIAFGRGAPSALCP